VDIRFLQKNSFFWSPEFLEVSAWIEHTPFAFWVIETLKPKTVVELGVHAGTSYFSFCQAIKGINSNTACYGVDTWVGDEHAGYYGAEIYEKVAAHNTEKYSRFSTLIRATFDEASTYFIDGTIDLLHIDGLHTYEAVKHDFETWLPKLSPNAVVLFHDINVRERNFGVFTLWEELKQSYRNFQYDFGHGLGVLTLGTDLPEEVNFLFDSEKNNVYFSFLRNLFSERGSFFKTKMNFDAQLKLEKENVIALTATNARLEQNIQGLLLHNNNNDAKNDQFQKRLDALIASFEQLQENFKGLELIKNNFEEEIRLLTAYNSQLENKIQELTEAHKLEVVQHNALEINYGNIQERYQKDLGDISKELGLNGLSPVDIIHKLTEYKETLTQLNEQLRHQQQLIGWYRDTYELRSLFGVLKEKLSRRNNKAVPLPSAGAVQTQAKTG
jgi:hypothetical protein